MIKSHLQSKNIINPRSCPEAHLIIQANQFISGWAILETLLQSRLTICGATFDIDLDAKQCETKFEDGESLQEFYIKIQNLQNRTC